VLARILETLRSARWATLCVIQLRILLGFAFLPAGLKKLLDQPFTDPQNAGRFHDFLHAFHATGWFYQFVGAVQLVAAALLITQRFATAGAFLAMPVIATITMFCWSTGVVPTAIVATLMCLGTAGLLLWDLPRWRLVFAGDHREHTLHLPARGAPVHMPLWQACGVAIVVLYFGACIAMGGVYRPKGMELDQPGFYVMPVILLLPLVTLMLDQRRVAAARRGASRT
jgi:uncharacterized membrane protein YphA (DoxX/SURF4 family)